jgi:hypothetical protein
MTIASIGVVLEFLAIISITSDAEFISELPALSGAMWLLWAVAALGLLVHAAGARKPGAIMVIVGSIMFIPLGLVAIIGAKKMMKPSTEDIAERRRLAAVTEEMAPAPPMTGQDG